MEKLLPIFLAIPALGFLISFLLPANQEKWISKTIIYLMVGFVLFTTLFIICWLYVGSPVLNIKEISIYKTSHYNFLIDFYFDKVSAVYLLFSGVLTCLIAIYSRIYLHKEPGYKRFFITFMVFMFAIQVITLAGNFETLFIGWEFMGISSFLLIAYYRHRYLPVRSALKVFSVYRVADLGILLAMWLSHHFWHQNITFNQLNNSTVVSDHIEHNPVFGLIICLLILLAACVKSAQFPFSSWLPRAMEGPTPSSAIFYGSIAVHIGVFLLLRTATFWQQIGLMNYIIGGIGLTTAIMATISSRVQYSAKAQIAYSSIAQIGIIFIELAFELNNLALIHLTSNAFLRTYQLLISPSMVAYYIREQFYNFVPYKKDKKSKWLKRFEATIYVIGINEWKLDNNLYRLFWNPVKKIGHILLKFNPKPIYHVIFAIIPIAIYSYSKITNINNYGKTYLPELFSFIALLLVIGVFTDRKQAVLSWIMVGFSHLWVLLAVTYNQKFSNWDAIFYLNGIIFSLLLGLLVFKYLNKKENIDLNSFYGLAYEYPKAEFIFLIACLGLMGFPITTTFLGEDLLLSHIEENQYVLVTIISFTYVLTGISIVRMYARLFLGPVHNIEVISANRAA